MVKQRKIIEGFSLIELLIAMMIVSVVMVVSIQAITKALQQMALEEHRLYAMYYAEELINFISVSREVNWSEFANKSNQPPITYCVNSIINPRSTINQILANTGRCSQFNGIAGDISSIPHIYKREVSLAAVSAGVNSPVSRVNAVVTVYWRDFNREENVSINSSFTIHE